VGGLGWGVMEVMEEVEKGWGSTMGEGLGMRGLGGWRWEGWGGWVGGRLRERLGMRWVWRGLVKGERVKRMRMGMGVKMVWSGRL
ncbi:hypothetical protein, partial [Micrococcus luteus]|uniref:hypothetical protein n=1 Tax=Micrococcus luteus TaxID=1270 RepID=UPI001C92DAE1